MTVAEVIPESLLPVRRGDTIPVVSDGPFIAATSSWQLSPPQNALIVIVKATATIIPDEAAQLRDEPDFFSGELRSEDDPAASAIYPSDFALFKPRADVIVVGSAHAPGGSTTAMNVGLHFGHRDNRIEKRILVIGDRVWQRGLSGTVPGDPVPFAEMPLAYEHAYGGPELASNPWGRGHRDSPLMPNLERIGQLVTSPQSKMPPACLAPLALDYPARWKKIGHYDRSWLKNRWPYFAADFDWSFFQDAPADQQLNYLRGDEPFEAEGVAKELPFIRGSLPGRVPRAFMLPREPSDVEGAMVPVALELDTVVLDFHAQAVQLVWRGSVPVSADDAPEHRGIFLTDEPVDGPRVDRIEALRRCRIALTPLEPVETPAPEEPPANDTATAPAEEEIDEAQTAAELEKSIHAQLAAAGVPDDGPPAAPLPPPDPEAMAAYLREAGAEEEDIQGLLAAVREPVEPPAEDEADGTAPGLRQRVEAMLAARESFADFDFEQGDLSDLDFSSCDLVRARMEKARFCRCRFDSALLLEAQLGGADCSDGSFAQSDLSLADLTGATLAGARFEEAVLNHTVLAGAHAPGASFAGSQGENTVFVAGQFDECCFDRIVMSKPDFSRASLVRARFVGAEAPHIMLYDASAPGAFLDGAKLENARAEGADLSRASLRGVMADGAVFENALLDEAVLRGADLKGASFLRATCRRADFTEADLSEGRLDRAQLQGAVLRRASLMMASLDHADLNIADLRDANLHSAGLWDANLLDCRLGGAIVTKSTLVMRSP